MKINKYFILAAIFLVIYGCENEKHTFSDISTIYLTGDPAQNATADSVLFSFKLFNNSVTTYDVNLIVNIAGTASDQERSFDLEIVPEKTTAAPGDYTVGALVIPANSFKATVPVNVKRNITSVNLATTPARVTFRVKPNDNFGIGAWENAEYTVAWCDFLTQPTTWSIISYYIGNFTQARFKFIIDFTGKTEFSEFAPGGSTDYNMVLNFQATLIRLLNEYNASHPGSPYLNDNGQPLQFGSGLQY